MSTDESNINVQGYNIVTLLKRLEAATSRLEDVTIFQEKVKGQSDDKQKEITRSYSPTSSQAITAGQSSVASSAPASAPAPVPTQAPKVIEEKSKSVVAFEDFIAEYVDAFTRISSKIDPVVIESANAFLEGFKAEVIFLTVVSKAKQPEFSNPKFAESLKPINSQIEEINSIKEKNRKSIYFNHLNTISEGAAALGWIVTTTPVSLIPGYKESAQFWSNRVIKEYKEKDTQHVEWVQSFLKIFDGLRDYVKEYHTTGPSWNPNGIPFEEAVKKQSSVNSAPANAGAPPPPPPPPPPPASVFESSSSEPVGMNAVFGELNKGEAITAGLKKVDKSQMTHKNPALRGSSTVPAKKTSPVPPKKPNSLTKKLVKKAPKKELVDSKWIIENVENDHEIIIQGEMQQSVFIGKCSDITIQIKGKINAVSLSECTKVGLVVDSLVSGVDVIKSSKYGIQVIDQVPMISIDQSDDGQIYLSKSSLSTEVFTSQTTSLNINVPKSDDFVEVPVPEQFKHSFSPDGKMTSTIVDHAG